MHTGVLAHTNTDDQTNRDRDQEAKQCSIYIIKPTKTGYVDIKCQVSLMLTYFPWAYSVIVDCPKERSVVYFRWLQ